MSFPENKPCKYAKNISQSRHLPQMHYGQSHEDEKPNQMSEKERNK